MFQLTVAEFANLRSQIATSSSAWGGRRYAPYAFTEHGAIMAASVLSSDRAVAVSIMVVRAFVRLRQVLWSHADLARKLNAMEQKFDARFRVIFEAIRELMEPVADKHRPRIGFGRE